MTVEKDEEQDEAKHDKSYTKTQTGVTDFITKNLDKEMIDEYFLTETKQKQPKFKGNASINYDLCYFSYHVIQERYLLIIGGKTTWETFGRKDKPHNRMFYFDFEKQSWHVSPMLLPFTIFGHASVCLLKGNKIFIIGGMINGSQYSSANFSFKLTDVIPDLQIQWECERQMWIAYYKNSNNRNCFVPRLPEVILIKILKFLRL